VSVGCGVSLRRECPNLAHFVSSPRPQLLAGIEGTSDVPSTLAPGCQREPHDASPRPHPWSRHTAGGNRIRTIAPAGMRPTRRVPVLFSHRLFGWRGIKRSDIRLHVVVRRPQQRRFRGLTHLTIDITTPSPSPPCSRRRCNLRSQGGGCAPSPGPGTPVSRGSAASDTTGGCGRVLSR
jgi:hypothetical protein